MEPRRGVLKVSWSNLLRSGSRSFNVDISLHDIDISNNSSLVVDTVCIGAGVLFHFNSTFQSNSSSIAVYTACIGDGILFYLACIDAGFFFLFFIVLRNQDCLGTPSFFVMVVIVVGCGFVRVGMVWGGVVRSGAGCGAVRCWTAAVRGNCWVKFSS